MRRNNFLTAMLILCFMINMFAVSASAEELRYTSGDYSYTLNDGNATIVYYSGDSYIDEYIVPSTLDGYPVTAIGNYAFKAKNFYEITIPEGVVSIGDYAFAICRSAEIFNLPSSLTQIGKNAFDRCHNIMSFKVDSQNKYFRNLDGNLYNKEITALIRYASGKNDGQYVIPDGVTEIADGAFSRAYNIGLVTIPQSVTSIGEKAFQGSGIARINIPEGVTYIGNGAFSATPLMEITVDENNSKYCDVDGNLYSKDMSEMLQYSTGKVATEFSVPDKVKKIGDWAFCGCNNLLNISIPNGVTDIGMATFESCENLEEITLPEGIEEIKEDTFHYCLNLSAITIPKSIKSIGQSAFSECNSLTDVYYEGSEEEWNEMVIESGNEKLKSANIIYKTQYSVDVIAVTASKNTLKFISKAEFSDGQNIASFGTVFMPLWVYKAGIDDAVMVEYDNSEYNISGGQTFGVTLTGIPETCRSMEIVAKSFIKDLSGDLIWSEPKSASLTNPVLTNVNEEI